jgi:hypothetical protein
MIRTFGFHASAEVRELVFLAICADPRSRDDHDMTMG